MIHVLVVDDSAFMRKLISDYINEETDMTAQDTARNGKDAIKKIGQKSYDVITLDVEMPEMNGIEALKTIMKETPLPVIMVSSLTIKGARQTIEAMEVGAVDFVAKPSGSISLDLHHVKEELIHKIRTAAEVDMRAQRFKTPSPAPLKEASSETLPVLPEKKIMSIAASTGGPKALQLLLPVLPEDFPAPVFVVQHMPPAFTRSLAERLDQLSRLHVKEAEDGEIAKRGVVYIAPGGNHLSVRKMGRSLVNELSCTPPVNGHRPSANVLFSSLSQISDYGHIGVVLTGMGSDGADGLSKMRAAQSCFIITESQKTSVVYGMPKVAAEKAKSDRILDIENIAGFLTAHFSPGQGNKGGWI
ncbi:protein-glutamate methylesterase/protein-glutamine glutaminase [Salibacterium aidingense]|uniref:protein-glutamate methylesterase/protein-glutamine glutaminase n=1 Tax=Salibacterium aidingense TaxID=384933 RepID=UPI0004186155|nr:chemotaxis response regulator protein-glutamate methylesterase [Salibacterium aidingense]